MPPPGHRIGSPTAEGAAGDRPDPTGSPIVLPPASPYAHTGRLDHAMRIESPLPGSGVAVDTWCDPAFEATRLAVLVEAFRAVAAGAARLDDVHHTHPRLVRGLLDTTEALCLPGIALGPDLAIESSRLLTHRAGQEAAVPCHQDGIAPGLLLDARHAMTAVYLLAHDGALPFARVAVASLADAYLPHRPVAAGAFGTLLRAERGRRRWMGTDIDLRPGQALYLDTRTLRSIGTDASWSALTLRLVTPLGVVRRPADAPVLRSLRAGSRVRWHDPASLQRARRRAFGPGHDTGADAILAAAAPVVAIASIGEEPHP
ncbi:hypothetical protein [Embleya sp. NPDC059237]|uniref:hypothetical protein n=1 Tax=Embleya sp. NPDC059237 TaxID=3346784 RepID=UPI00369FC1A9